MTEVVDNGRRRERRPRSAVTSGRRLFVLGDPNSAWARRFHDLVVGHVADLGGRGELTEAVLGDQAAGGDEVAVIIDRGQLVLARARDDRSR